MSEGEGIERAIVKIQEQVLFLERHVEELDVTVRDLAGQLDEVRRDLSRLMRQIEQHNLDQELPDETPGDDFNAGS